ncbi:hypothetical protein BDZ89DRAFT_1158669 [Hymenopellis radicata]|nr:hypothetical protein BDZ89DRAFT_1158669 [Hymenopellis radicata]
MSGPHLPPELVELIVQHLWDHHTLQSCALISWTCVIPCQRALFCSISLRDYNRVVRFLPHLRRYPHLQPLIQWMVISQTCATRNGEARNEYLSCLTALFLLLPRLTSLRITFGDRSRSWNTHDDRFIEAFGAFLHTSKFLTELTVHNLRDQIDFQQLFSFLKDSSVKRVALDTLLPSVRDWPAKSFPRSNLSVVHLPALELLRVDLTYIVQFHTALGFWLRQYPGMFPNLQHCEVVVNQPFIPVLRRRDALRVALRFESFKLELLHYFLDHPGALPAYEGLFEGFHFKHFKICLFEPGLTHHEARTYINWLSSMFRYLADSGSTIHFTELTFTFSNRNNIEAASAVWKTLDEVLSHAAFYGVQRIHFEEENCPGDTNTLITDQVHPELASTICCTLPCLASRGVLCLS